MSLAGPLCRQGTEVYVIFAAAIIARKNLAFTTVPTHYGVAESGLPLSPTQR